MVQPLLSIPSLSFSQEPVPYYEETARSIEEKTSELEEKIGSSS